MQSKLSRCENCQTPLQGEYCHSCGQRGIELRRPIIGLAQDIIAETLSIDSRLWRTIRGLFMNPGLLAKTYIDGKRVVYTPPFRIFLFFSLVFFALLFLSINNESANTNTLVQFERSDNSFEQHSKSDENLKRNLPETDQSNAAGNPSQTDDIITYSGPERFKSLIKTLNKSIKEAENDPRLFLAKVRNNMPRILFILPLFYPILLMIFYFSKKEVFTYNLLIISLYMHAALYFYLGIVIALQASPLSDIPVLGQSHNLLQLWAIFQSYRVLAINFNSKWWSVLIKGTLINGLYWLVATILIMAGMAISLL